MRRICRRTIDPREYMRLFQECDDLAGLRAIHGRVVVDGHGQNPFLAAKLVELYSALGGHGGHGWEVARKVFDDIGVRDAMLWNVMIRSSANAGAFAAAIMAYKRMRSEKVVPNRYTFPFVLRACAAAGGEKKGREIHGHVLGGGVGNDLFVCNALVAFYAKCRDVAAAEKVFHEMPERDLVSWNSLLAGYGQNELWWEALALFHRMMRGDIDGYMTDRVTLVSVLPVLAHLASIREGMWVHGYIVKSGMGMDVGLGSGMVGLYAKCGHLMTAKEVFDRMPERNVVAWNAVIDGYGMHGYAREAVALFWEMVNAGIDPDHVSFVSVLSACSHGGLVEVGMELFRVMDRFRVERSGAHYACIVDLLGRAGQLKQAVGVIQNMPMEGGKDVWGALLGACRIHKDLQLAELATKKLLEIEPENAGRYVLLAKMYEEVGRCEEVAMVRKLMRERKVRKPMGCSMIEVGHVVHTFGMEDQSEPMFERIYEIVEQLHLVVEEEMAATRSVCNTLCQVNGL